jgi:NADH-quinone oxidoreductase subunit A
MIQYLLQVSASGQHPDSSFWYFPVGLQLLFALLFVGVMMGVTHWLGQRNTSTSWKRLPVSKPVVMPITNGHQVFLVAILFVLFDVE